MLVRNLVNQNWRTQINGIIYNFEANGTGITVPDFFRDLIKKGNLGSRLKEVRLVTNLYEEDEKENKPTQNISVNESSLVNRLSSAIDLEEKKLLEAEAENIKKVNEDIKTEFIDNLDSDINKEVEKIDNVIDKEIKKKKAKKKKAKKKKAKKKKVKTTIDNYIVKED